MQILSASPYRRYFIAALIVLVITSIFSLGYNNFDEHFQILEFCGYKMGLSPASALPWEFTDKIRPALQPFIAYCLSQALVAIGAYNPFTVALILRMLMAVLTWWVSCRLIVLLLPQFKTERGKKLYVLSSLFLWFVAYIGVRFSAENFAGTSFFMALSLLLEIRNGQTNKAGLKLFIAGALVGLALFARVQMAFAVLGLAIWIIFLAKWPVRYWLWLKAGGVVAIALSIIIDYWFYGEWLITPYNYFNVNLLQHKAVEFGVFPWYQYFIAFFESAVPPLSIALLIAFLAGVKQKPLHLFSMVCIPFLIGHFAVGHKEMRFLFPMTYALIFLAGIGVDHWVAHYKRRRIFNFLFALVVITNCGVLVYRMFFPAEIRVKYYQYLYHAYKEQPNTVLVFYKESPYSAVTLQTNFYKPKNLDIRVIQNAGELQGIVNSESGKNILFFSPSLIPPPEFSAYKMERKYTLFPEWVLGSNVNNWQDRTEIWAVYKVK